MGRGPRSAGLGLILGMQKFFIKFNVMWLADKR